MAADGKIVIDDNALFRQKEYATWAEPEEANPLEYEAKQAGLTYVKLDGNVGIIGNLVPQLHVHVVSRCKTDAAWPAPVWGHGQTVPYGAVELMRGLTTGVVGWSMLGHVGSPNPIHPFAAPRGDQQGVIPFRSAGHPGASSEDTLKRQARSTDRDRSIPPGHDPASKGGDVVREDPPFPRPVASVGRRIGRLGSAQMGGQRSAAGRG
jgi:hypothetical protein